MGKKIEFEGEFEADIKVRKLRNGHRMQLVLEAPWDSVAERRLILFRFARVKALVTLSEEQESLFPEADPDDPADGAPGA